ncbi:MAG TPA: aminoglycoside phosphotransferase family protein [Thermomicrobiales bacterium]|nr:aminoglycoside phosphotransferase family protein [Thermomicrobiales bacterium]
MSWLARKETPLTDGAVWPERLREAIERHTGGRFGVERLSGMSFSGVWRVSGAAGSTIVKASQSGYEASFYEGVASSLRRAGVPIPDLLLALDDGTRHWLLLEDIPEPLPVASGPDWQPDGQIVEILARLHATTRARPPRLPNPPARNWTDAMTQSALGCLTDQGTDLEPLLATMQHEAQELSQPWCWISGDPNPRNWGLRGGRQPVLFDWELFGPGLPAIDLAIIVPGLGDAAAYRRVADAYDAVWPGPDPLPWDTDQLGHQIAVAKVATVVQLLDSHATGRAEVGDELLDWLADSVPTWVGQIARSNH